MLFPLQFLCRSCSNSFSVINILKMAQTVDDELFFIQKSSFRFFAVRVSSLIDFFSYKSFRHFRALHFHRALGCQKHPCSDRAFKQYLMEQQRMRWQLNLKIQVIYDKENNLLKNEERGVCQSIKKYMALRSGWLDIHSK